MLLQSGAEFLKRAGMPVHVLFERWQFQVNFFTVQRRKACGGQAAGELKGKASALEFKVVFGHTGYLGPIEITPGRQALPWLLHGVLSHCQKFMCVCSENWGSPSSPPKGSSLPFYVSSPFR